MLSLRLEQLEMFCATETHSQEGSVAADRARWASPVPLQERRGGVLLCEPPPRLSPACSHQEHRSAVAEFPFPTGPRAQIPIVTVSRERGGCRSWAAGLAAPPAFGLAAAGLILGGQSRLLAGWPSEEAGEGQLQLWQMLAGERAEAAGAGGC